jgi:hypothetical protein
MRLELEAGRFDSALELAQDLGRLGLRFPRDGSGERALDPFYRLLISASPVVPHEKWHLVLAAFVRADAEVALQQLEAVPDMRLPKVAAADDAVLYLEARLAEMRKEWSLDLGREFQRLSESPALGPRTRSQSLIYEGWQLHTGELPKRLELTRRAVELDTSSWSRRMDHAFALRDAGKLEEARAELVESQRLLAECGLVSAQHSSPEYLAEHLAKIDALIAARRGGQ